MSSNITAGLLTDRWTAALTRTWPGPARAAILAAILTVLPK
jgi:hypothetical protein